MSTTNPISRRFFLAARAKVGAAGLAASTVESLFAANTGAARKPAWQIGCYTRVESVKAAATKARQFLE